MTNIVRGFWARAYCNDDFLYIETVSGYRGGTHADPKGKQYFLKPDESEEKIGAAIVDSLEKSRWVLAVPREGSEYPETVEFDPDLYDYEKSMERYNLWVKDILIKYNYKNKRALFKKMKNCFIERKDGLITINPSHHVKLEAWDGFCMDDHRLVKIPDNSSNAEVGKALKVAFSHCT